MAMMGVVATGLNIRRMQPQKGFAARGVMGGKRAVFMEIKKIGTQTLPPKLPKKLDKKVTKRHSCWRMGESNPRHLACEASTLPLS